MVEWTKAPHWKCGEVQASEGSNPSLSAIFFCKKMANEDVSLLFTLFCILPQSGNRKNSSLKRRSLFFTSSPPPGEDLLVKSFHSAIAPFHL